MESLLSLLATPQPGSTMPQEALRRLSAVASGWIMVGAVLLLCTNGAVTRTAERLHLIGGSCLLIATAIYSVVFPLQALLRKHTTSA